MQPRCPTGTVILQDFNACGYPCESGYVVLDRDDSFCVGTLCPVTVPAMTKDPNDNSVCWKTPVTKTGYNCATGFTEWIPTKCFIDCPTGFRENAQSCIIPTKKRRLAQLECPYLSVLNGDKCTPASMFFWILSIFTILVAFFAYRLTIKSGYSSYGDDVKISRPPPANSAWRF
jgi:hypothetical protein